MKPIEGSSCFSGLSAQEKKETEKETSDCFHMAGILLTSALELPHMGALCEVEKCPCTTERKQMEDSEQSQFLVGKYVKILKMAPEEDRV